ncbi:ribbon-helix-helix domain-containing protein [Halorarius litoreus]|uniref:ribbon-helix-helix domain-containing protein n=1 Tax=Halorarius litoreus TaxID=2962676 RepID=UPI0020CCB953|nr:ribbon-helix-helix domain-containing protein [Halorarius litoreus]
MSGKTIPGSEREKKVTVRVPQDLADEYDARCDQLGVSRSESVRTHMRQAVDAPDEDTGGRVPPSEDDLARTYEALLKLTGPGGGFLRDDRAKQAIAQALGVDKGQAWALVRRLRERGYVGLTTDSTMRFTGVKVRA